MARVAQWLGALGLLSGLAGWIYIVNEVHHTNAEVQRQLAELKRDLGDAASRPVLTQPTACQLAQQHLLIHGYNGGSPNYLNAFSCPGKLTVAGEEATLEAYTFSPSENDPPLHAWVCLHHGSAWYVEAVQATACTPGAAGHAPAK